MQLSLFGPEPIAVSHKPAKALARSSHPETSKKAAEEVVEVLPAMESIALEAVLSNPGLTAREHDKDRTGDRVVGKRLSSLREKGLVREGDERVCTVSGFEAVTWYPTTEALLGRLG